jgi:S-formylglutathione hydrolase FrmB
MLLRLGSALATVTLTAGALQAPAAAAPAPAFKKSSTGATITAYKWLTKNKRAFDFAVRSNRLGSTQKVRVLLPKGWSYKAKRTWPVLYLMHGGNAHYDSWTRSTKIEQLAAKWNVIVVMPEGANGSYTNWYNNGQGGIPEWETFHMTEVFQLMARNFHAGKSRAIMGNSSGGQGAITYAARYPKRFKYAASFSGLLSLLSPGVPDALAYVNQTNGLPEAIYGNAEADRANWLAHDPWNLAPKLRGTKIFFSSGSGAANPFDASLFSEYVVGMTNADFQERLDQLKIPYKSHIYAGGRHSWGYWVRELGTAWPAAMKAIKAKRVGR